VYLGYEARVWGMGVSDASRLVASTGSATAGASAAGGGGSGRAAGWPESTETIGILAAANKFAQQGWPKLCWDNEYVKDLRTNRGLE
jgi:hypothetical protein